MCACAHLRYSCGETTHSGCPFRQYEDLREFLAVALDAFGHYRNGFLFVAGGIGEQPYPYVKAMGILSGELSSMESENRENEMRKINSSFGRN